MRNRVCNIFRCEGRMRFTGNLHHIDKRLGIFKCIKCGNEQPWLLNPDMNGSFGELHYIKTNNSYHVTSMMSDPRFYKPKRSIKG